MLLETALADFSDQREWNVSGFGSSTELQDGASQSDWKSSVQEGRRKVPSSVMPLGEEMSLEVEVAIKSDFNEGRDKVYTSVRQKVPSSMRQNVPGSPLGGEAHEEQSNKSTFSERRHNVARPSSPLGSESPVLPGQPRKSSFYEGRHMKMPSSELLGAGEFLRAQSNKSSFSEERLAVPSSVLSGFGEEEVRSRRTSFPEGRHNLPPPRSPLREQSPVVVQSNRNPDGRHAFPKSPRSVQFEEPAATVQFSRSPYNVGRHIKVPSLGSPLREEFLEGVQSNHSHGFMEGRHGMPSPRSPLMREESSVIQSGNNSNKELHKVPGLDSLRSEELSSSPVQSHNRKGRHLQAPSSPSLEDSRHLPEDAIPVQKCKTTRHAYQPGQFFGQEAPSTPPSSHAGRRPMQPEEMIGVVRSSSESPRPPLPPGMRARTDSTDSDPYAQVKSVVGGKGSRTVSANSRRTHANAPASDWQTSGRETFTDRESVDSDDGEASSPVSTLDCPTSPLSATSSPSPNQQPSHAQPRSSHKGGSGGRRAGHNSGTSSSQATNTMMALAEMSDELPSVMEEDEEDLESVHGFHTIEFNSMDSPVTSEDRRERRDRSFSRRPKSLSAPISRQSSSLRPGGAGNRGRRRSDFDWPEDFEERAEEVVKEVDESLWAFSPVASTFVYSGNEHVDRRTPSPLLGRGALTPSGSSISSGSARRSLVRSMSSKHSFGAMGSTKNAAVAAVAAVPVPFVETPPQRMPMPLARLRQYSVNGDDDYLASTGQPMKRSFSCMPLFSLCKQRPTPTITFSQRLSPGMISPSK